ncbi:MAG: hypothetical protein OXM55_02540 [Bdellovibrionales bacterium]|nr:hypothetical protein [Bdellovibrionales bacterium]
MKHIDIPYPEILCRLEKRPKHLTVGDIFELHCEWPLSLILSSPVRIEFHNQDIASQGKNRNFKKEMQNNQPGPYALFVLDTVSILPGKGVFKVTSYQPGHYNTGFRLVSDEGVAKVKSLLWKVNSVLPQNEKETIQPFPPYGPWKEVLPFWYKPLAVLVLLSLIVFIAVKTRTFLRRRKKIREVKRRLRNKKPFREFISQLNLLMRELNKKDGKQIIRQVETAFRLFLENQFFIFAKDEKPKKIVQQIKKHYPVILKKCDIEVFFAEIERLSSERVSSEDSEQLLNMAREQAIKIYQQGGNSVG